jgi:RHS repeat-associated protein
VYIVMGPDGRVAQLTRTGAESPTIEYILTDALGSTSSVLDGAANIIDRAFFEPFGLRIEADGTPYGGSIGSVRDGFTGHGHDAAFGLIDMRGRMFDPTTKQFLSADPIVSVPLFGQSWNPYSYVGNSPLNVTDPSGYRWSGEWSCMNVPGGCVDGGSGGGGEPSPPDQPTETSPGSQAAMDGFMAGSEAAMDGSDVARSDGASSGARPSTPAPTVVGKYENAIDNHGELFDVEYLSDGKMRIVNFPKLGYVSRDFVWRLFMIALHRYEARDEHGMPLGLPLTEENARKYSPVFQVPAYGFRVTPAARISHEDEELRGDMSLFGGDDPNSHQRAMAQMATRSATKQAAEATIEALAPYIDVPGVEDAIFSFTASMHPSGMLYVMPYDWNGIYLNNPHIDRKSDHSGERFYWR